MILVYLPNYEEVLLEVRELPSDIQGGARPSRGIVASWYPMYMTQYIYIYINK